MTLTFVSFGYLHLTNGQAPPAADHVEDVRDQLADPAAYHQVLAWLEDGPVDGREPRVQQLVLDTPGADRVMDRLATIAARPGVRVVAIGCGQGHDRSVALAELLAARDWDGRPVGVEHWHVDLPRVR